MGLDLNVVAHMTWQAAPLQFVAGLGPRKAQLLARTAQREQFVHTRLFLFRELGILGKAVFRQATPSLIHMWQGSTLALQQGKHALNFFG